MEIEIFQGLEFGFRRTEQLFTLGNMRIHRTTDIEQH